MHNKIPSLEEDESFPIVINALLDDNKSLRCTAIEALGKFSIELVMNPLFAALEDEDRDVKDTIKRVLRKLASQDSSKIYLRSLIQTESADKYKSVIMLGLAGEKESIDLLIETLDYKCIIITGANSLHYWKVEPTLFY
ncbi:MAG: HEAT repeat domain-containing protein [Candidatus Heimdallarchaeaceae archaeon]